MDSDALIEVARSWLGVPFRHQGRSRAGVDCSGLLICCARDLGEELIAPKAYGRTPHRGLLEKYLDLNFKPGEMKPGAILLMRFDSEPQHIAILAGKTIIHSYLNAGKVVEHRFADVWRARVTKVYYSERR